MKVSGISTEISKKNSQWPLEQLGTGLMGNKLSHLGHFPFTELRPGSVILTLRVEPVGCWWLLFIFCGDNKGELLTAHTSHLATISWRLLLHHKCNPVASVVRQSEGQSVWKCSERQLSEWQLSQITLKPGLTVPRLVVNWRRSSLECLGGWGCHSIIDLNDIKRNIL